MIGRVPSPTEAGGNPEVVEVPEGMDPEAPENKGAFFDEDNTEPPITPGRQAYAAEAKLAEEYPGREDALFDAVHETGNPFRAQDVSYDIPPEIAHQDGVAEARAQGYDWGAIDAHLGAATAVAASEGYPQADIDNHLGYQSGQGVFDRAKASYSRAFATEEDRIKQLGQSLNADGTSPVDLTHDTMPGDYADAFTRGEVKGPEEFAQQHAQAWLQAAAQAGADLTDVDFRNALASSTALSSTLPDNKTLTDVALGVADQSGQPLGPGLIATIKKNLLDAWATTGSTPEQTFASLGQYPELVQPLSQADLIKQSDSFGRALQRAAQMTWKGVQEPWQMGHTEFYKAMEGLSDRSTNPVTIGVNNAIRVGVGTSEAAMATIASAVFGVTRGASSLLESLFYGDPAPNEDRDSGIKFIREVLGPVQAMLPEGFRLLPKSVVDSFKVPEDIRRFDPLKAAHEQPEAMPLNEAFRPDMPVHDAAVTLSQGGALAKANENQIRALATQNANDITTGERIANPIRVWHASPYEFDRFSSEHIGTGEGHQAFSRGLYFAELLDTHIEYLQQFAPSPKYRDLAGNAHDLDYINPEHAAAHLIDDYVQNNKMEHADARHAALSDLESSHEEQQGFIKKIIEQNDRLDAKLRGEMPLDNLEDMEMVKQVRDANQHSLDDMRARLTGDEAVAEHIRERTHGDVINGDRPYGYSYIANLHVKPEETLAWDESLHKQASDKWGAPEKPDLMMDEQYRGEGGRIKYQADHEAWENEFRDWANDKGISPSSFMGNGEMFINMLEDRYGPEAAVAKLKELGVKASKYRDGGSRSVFEERPTYNWVVYHDPAIELFARDGKRIELPEVQQRLEGLKQGYDIAGAVHAAFHNMMVDTAGGVSLTGVRNFFRTPDARFESAARRVQRGAVQNLVREYSGQAERVIQAHFQSLEKFMKLINSDEYMGAYEKWMKMGPARSADEPVLHQFLKFVEGRSVGETFDRDSPLYPVADGLQRVYRDMRERIEAVVPDMSSFYQDYYRHMWRDPRAADKVFDGMGAGKQGSAKSLNQRSIPTIADGIEKGLMPRFLNPIENTLHYVEGMARHLAARQVLDDLRTKFSYVDYYGGPKKDPAEVRPPPGWEPIGGYANTRVRSFVGKDGEAHAIVERAYAPPAIARTYNQWIGRGWHDVSPTAGKLYDGVRAAANMSVGMLLGFSGYHFMNIAQEVMVNTLSNALGEISRGQLWAGMRDMGYSMALPVQLPRQVVRGGRLGKEYLDLSKNTEFTDLFASSGNRFGTRQDIYKMGSAKGFFEMRRQGLYVGRELWRDFKDIFGTSEEAPAARLAKFTYRAPGFFAKEFARITNTAMEPLFDYVIPRVKTAAWSDEMNSWLAKNRSASREDKLRYARKLTDSIDDRFGEMNQNNLFWNPILKQTVNAATVSVGWEFGSLRAQFGMFHDMATSGKADEVVHRLRWLMAFPMIQALNNGVYQYFKTGVSPLSSGTPWQDLANPRIGGVDDKGMPQRGILPGYSKDYYQQLKIYQQYRDGGFGRGSRQLLDYIIGKGNPIAQAAITMGREFTDPIGHKVLAEPRQALHWPMNTQPLYNSMPKGMPQALSFFEGLVRPIIGQSIEGAKADEKLGIGERFLGVRRAPSFMENPGKFFGTQQWLDRKDEAAETKRYNKENSARMYPGDPAEVEERAARQRRARGEAGPRGDYFNDRANPFGRGNTTDRDFR